MPAPTAPLKLAAVACALLFGGLGIYLAPLQPSVVALQFTFTPNAFAQVLQAWGPEGVQRFRTHLAVDGLLLLSYSAAGYLAVARTRVFRPLATWLPLRWVALLLPLAALCDAGENLLHWGLTQGDALAAPSGATWYLVAGLCAAFKWVGIAVFALSAVIARLRC
ncbi:hypothetical protein [Rhodoferax sp.]|uniref:hypothetical protein n=1 Tax=Rhodoferax sp. TaxID=50421 RepID=UPI0025F1F8DC|nr:hypothetical protein [Rhodoferax sp.]